MTEHRDSTLETAREEGRDLLRGSEGAALAEAAGQARHEDIELAASLDRPGPSGQGTTAVYLADLAGRPTLPQAFERELVAAAQAGDPDARERLVEAFMPLVASVARMYRQSPSVDRIELLQEGVVGLLRALERYDAGRGTPFWGYASFWVRQAMQQLVAELTRPAVLSDRALRHLARLRDAHSAMTQETGREPALSELSARAGLSVDQVEDLLSVERAPRSVEERAPGDDAAVGTFGDLLVDPLAEGEYERVLDSIQADQLLALLAGLSERERRVLRARYGIGSDGEESLRSIADRLGISAERVRQIERRALGKLAAAAGVDG